jgi:hypothetical protein
MLRVALALVTMASTAAVAAAPGGISPDAPASGFGGPAAVHLAHVGHIEIALGSHGTVGLRHVRCAPAAATTTSCYLGR